MPRTEIVEVFIARQVIADDVMGFPASKKREAGTDLHLHRVIQDKEVAGGDVSDFISVIDVLSSRWENGLYGEKRQPAIGSGLFPVKPAKPITPLSSEKPRSHVKDDKIPVQLHRVIKLCYYKQSATEVTARTKITWLLNECVSSSPVSNIPDSEGSHHAHQDSNSLFIPGRCPSSLSLLALWSAKWDFSLAAPP